MFHCTSCLHQANKRLVVSFKISKRQLFHLLCINLFQILCKESVLVAVLVNFKVYNSHWVQFTFNLGKKKTATLMLKYDFRDKNAQIVILCLSSELYYFANNACVYGLSSLFSLNYYWQKVKYGLDVRISLNYATPSHH